MRIIKIFLTFCLVSIAFIYVWFHSSSTITLSVMTFNIENGGTQIDFNKVVEAVEQSKADVVGLQEAWGHTALLAQQLGWKYYDSSQHIVSRFPLLSPAAKQPNYVFVEVKPGFVIAIANMHLPDENYGPELIQKGAKAKTVEAMEKKMRLPTALPFIQNMASLAKQGVPVFLTGDFNSPSHLDWQDKHVIWPVTKTLEQSGLVDAYRQIYPDRHQHPVTTWPAGRPIALHSFDGFNPSKHDLADRIDFVFTGGPSKVINAAIIGEPGYSFSDIKIWPWPSDHRAVVASFVVIPAAISTFKVRALADAHGSVTRNDSDSDLGATITVSKNKLQTSKPITLSWQGAPGNRYDYIMIAPVGSKKTAWGEAVRLYTFGAINGRTVYDQHNAKGNWLAWYTASEGQWPLKPGVYDVKLMLDDSYTVLAKTRLTVTT